MPDWLQKVNPYIYLSIASLVMIVFSMVYDNEKYINIWFLSYLYGILGFASSVALSREKHPKVRKLILGFSLFVYVLGFFYFWTKTF